jgi:hypothetical protein
MKWVNGAPPQRMAIATEGGVRSIDRVIGIAFGTSLFGIAFYDDEFAFGVFHFE